MAQSTGGLTVAQSLVYALISQKMCDLTASGFLSFYSRLRSGIGVGMTKANMTLQRNSDLQHFAQGY